MQMEHRHKLALKCTEAVEQQHRLSLEQEFLKGKNDGRRLIAFSAALSPSNAIVQARYLARLARPTM
jgi:hypothetical protein